MDTSSSTGHRNGADLVVWTAGNTRSLGPVPLHTSGRRFDTVRAPPLLRRLRSGPFRSLETLVPRWGGEVYRGEFVKGRHQTAAVPGAARHRRFGRGRRLPRGRR